MDTYQPIYDAVRNSLKNTNIGEAVESVMREANFCDHARMAVQYIHEAASEYTRPCVVFKPSINQDGNQWCALFGENLQTGVAGFGASPDAAMRAFDRAWYHDITTAISVQYQQR